MDIYILDLIVVGLLLLSVTLGSGWIVRLPLSYALIYLGVGVALGPYGFDLLQVRPDAQFLERLTEFVVIVSLFVCGLKMNRPLQPQAWNITVRLIGFLMPISILGIAAVGHWFLGMDWGPAILLGAILAPTDPVLASEVQLAHVHDQDELRFGLTSEGGLNDALAFPFVYFGLHALKDPNWDAWFKQWVLIDLIWAIAAGIGMGIVVAKAIIWLDKQIQKRRKADELMEDFLALSLILLAYAFTELVNGYGFLAVFVAGMTVRKSYGITDKQKSQLEFTEQIEQLTEIATIGLLGSMLRIEPMWKYGSDILIIAGLLIFLIRPVGTWISTLGGSWPQKTRYLFGWFGIRGVGSIYYLTYALSEGLKDELGEQIAWITFFTIVISMVLHGISATPLMKRYEQRNQQQQAS